MDSYPSPIPIQTTWIISENQLQTLLEGPHSTSIFSKENEVSQISGLKFKIQLQRYIDDSVSIFFTLIDLQNKEYWVNYIFCIKSANYYPAFSFLLFSCEKNAWGYKICSIDELFDSEKKFIVHGECIIEMKGMLYNAIPHQMYQQQKSFLQILWDRDDKDFTITAGKDVKKEIQVHKLILAARSPVFERMIQTEMKEKKEGKVDIIDFDAEVVLAAVEYCYEQHPSNLCTDIEKVMSLFQFADKYDMQDLKNSIELSFIQRISPQNICQIANAAILTNSTKLQDFCCQTMQAFCELKLSIDNLEILDKDFAFELLKKTYTFT